MKVAPIILFILMSAGLRAENPDSLRQVLARLQGAGRLPVLVQLCDLPYRSIIANEEGRQYAEEILRLAPAAHDTAAWVTGCLCMAGKQSKALGKSDAATWLGQAQALAARHPALMVKVLFWRGNYHLELGQADSALACFNREVRLCEKYRLPASEYVLSLGMAAKVYSNEGKAALADSLGRLAFRACKSEQDSACAFQQWGSVQEDLGHPEEAIRAYLEAYRLELKSGNIHLASYNLKQAAVVIREQGRYVQATGYLEESIRLAKSVQYEPGLASAYHSLGALYKMTGDYGKALQYFRQALAMKKDFGRPRKILTTIENMAGLYLETGQYDSVLALCKTYLPLSQKIEVARAETSLAFCGAVAAAKTGRTEQARSYLKIGEKAIGQVKAKEELPPLYDNAAQAYASLGFFEKAYRYQGLFQNAQDSIYNAEKSRIIAEMETRFETVKKEQEITALSNQNKLKNTQQCGLLGGLALSVLLAFALWRNARFRKQHNRELTTANTELNRKNHEVETLLREIHHRVKNNLQIISSLLRIQARHVSDENALDALRTGQARVRSMALLHQCLYQGGQLKNIPIKPYLNDLALSLFDAYRTDAERISFRTDLDDLALDVDTAVPLGLIANELITNSLKYAFPDGRKGEILLVLKKKKDVLSLKVVDNGAGLPLDGGKPVTNRTSFGLELVGSLTEKLNGQLFFSNGQGATIELVAPYPTSNVPTT
ncbi:MAG: tetratricopeptide repeat protein [Saprospiraceae bacterium]|nr:MAG: tetratricopeptide repeat protein [Saprospiraceae bacterium]